MSAITKGLIFQKTIKMTFKLRAEFGIVGLK